MSTEIRVADLVRQGYKSKEIAKIIGVSYKTVESHREKIRKKLNITQKKDQPARVSTFGHVAFPALIEFLPIWGREGR